MRPTGFAGLFLLNIFIMKYKFEISRMELKQNEFGKNDILIKQIKLMDENGKYIRFAKLNEALLDALKETGFLTVKK